MTTTPSERPVFEGFDPLSEEFQANPYPVLEQARRECPIFYYEPLNFWVITRFDDVAAMIPDWKKFSSRAFGVVPVPECHAKHVPKDFFSMHLLATDPPEHTQLRKNAQKALTKSRVAAMEPAIRKVANDLIDEFITAGSCDLMEQYANEVTLRAIVMMVGLPMEDLELFHRWSRDVVSVISPGAGADAPTKPMSEEERLERYGRIAEARQYFGRLIDERTAEPRDDLLSALVGACNEDGTPAFGRERIISHMGELLTAGSITTANLVGQMVMLFAAHPQQLEALSDDPELWGNAIEEGLRHSGSTLGVFRALQKDVTIRDVSLPAGSLVWLCYASTGRDEERFPDPNTFDVTRPDAADHLEFGLGPHFCMGAPLARLEARISLQTLYERIPGLRIPEQELSYNPAIVTTSLRHLFAEWDTTVL